MFLLDKISEKRVELINYIANAGMDYIKRLYDRPPIWKRYGERQAAISLHVPGQGGSRFDIACVRKRFDLIDLFVYEDQPRVFVEIGELAQVLHPVPTIVWLKPLEQNYAFLPDAFELGVAPLQEDLSAVFNRELNAVADRARVLLRDGAGHIVKSIPKAICAFANPNSYVGRDAVEGLGEGVDIRVIGDDTIVRMPNKIFQPRQVFATPIDHGVDFLKFQNHPRPCE